MKPPFPHLSHLSIWLLVVAKTARFVAMWKTLCELFVTADSTR